jgi:hypothetical protein
LLSHFLWKQTRDEVTDGGSKIQITISCNVDKIDHEEFRAARMLDRNRQDMLLDEWYRAVFLPRFAELKCSFRLLIDYFFWTPSLCRIVKEGNEEFVAFDQHGYETVKEIAKIHFKKNGCSVKLFALEASMDEASAEENNHMLRILNGVNAVENSEAYRKHQEAVVVTLINGRFQLEKQFMTAQSDQKHSAKSFDLRSRLIGQSLEISWDLKRAADGVHTFRGYRRENGFLPLEKGLEEHGTYFVETQRNGKAVQHIQDGKEYFYTFCLTVEEPVYANKSLMDTILFNDPKPVGTKTKIVDSVRFSARASTQEEKLRIERALDKIAGKSVASEDPKRAKLNHAFEELVSFVEFDENLSQWEKDLTARIESKSYSDEERKEKVERLKAVIESLRAANM